MGDKYSCDILIPKSDAANIARVNRAIAAAHKDGLDGKWAGVAPAQFKNPALKDGDGPRPNGEPHSEAYHGHLYVSAKSDSKPGVFRYVGKKIDGTPDFEPITDTTAVYSGCFCYVNVTFYAYNHKTGGKGIAVGLNDIVKIQDGEPLAGKPSIHEVMKDVEFEDVNYAQPDYDDMI